MQLVELLTKMNIIRIPIYQEGQRERERDGGMVYCTISELIPYKSTKKLISAQKRSLCSVFHYTVTKTRVTYGHSHLMCKL